jgi:hypothetical protein
MMDRVAPARVQNQEAALDYLGTNSVQLWLTG